MVHASAAEKKAVQEGWAIKRTLIGSNEFYIVGPKDDPAGIAQARSAAEAYKKVATAKVTMIARRDKLGTHAVWRWLPILTPWDCFANGTCSETASTLFP